MVIVSRNVKIMLQVYMYICPIENNCQVQTIAYCKWYFGYSVTPVAANSSLSSV